MDTIIDFNDIQNKLGTPGASGSALDKILQLNKTTGRLSLEQASSLLNSSAGEREKISQAAGEVKEKYFGKRIVLFAPLYVSNECVNNCLYCSFRRDHKEHRRATLSTEEVVSQAELLVEQGFRRTLLVYGEDPKVASPERIARDVQAIYEKTPLRIVHINAPPVSADDFRKLHRSGIGVFQSFQETYHPKTYAHMHPTGPKHDFDYRLGTMSRAFEGGFEDIGMGALLGLYDWRFETLSLLQHVSYLERKFGKGPHTISVPRLMPADGSILSPAEQYPVSDDEFKLLVAVLRLAVPYAGIVITTRESHEMRSFLALHGASQMSAGSRTNPGGYSRDGEDGTQFHVDDRASLPCVVEMLLERDCLPSFCATCYNANRQGQLFQQEVLGGQMKSNCEFNAFISLAEYIRKSAPEKMRAALMEKMNAMIERTAPDITSSIKNVLRKIQENDGLSIGEFK